MFIALFFVLFYEAINGFHDTSNAVATIIYTRAMRAQLSVFMSGIFNFLGVLFGGLSVAYVIVHMLPTNLLLNLNYNHSLAMVFSMLSAAIIWNLGTWYFGLPASSSHTLIGAIIGIGLTNAFINGDSIFEALNFKKIANIFLSLIISPIFGLLISGALILLLRRYWSNTKKRARIHMTPCMREKIDGKKKPPFWTRIALIISAMGVSYSHGANDGQKGIGLIMLVLITLVPGGFAVNMNASGYDIAKTRDAINHLEKYYQEHTTQFNIVIKDNKPIFQKKQNKQLFLKCEDNDVLEKIKNTKVLLKNLHSYDELSIDKRVQIRHFLLCISDVVEKVRKSLNVSIENKKFLKNLKKDLINTVEYAPIWIIFSIALALSIGTMIGWRRVVVTIGEKIGKNKMTYAQGMSAQLTAAVSIGIASYTGLPVSTTHILSSSVVGSILLDKGGLQINTIKNIVIAWIVTLPICIFLSSIFFWCTLKII
ncbi:phosphate transporter_ low-affinity [Candidatus Tachikawaea gelatinosa]|uniref:Phosphate transporter n=1 Tax=Candidatus Tachikawaea gelatinosa TaxID=1410383 RepID=A0A090AJ13_9ENTR|nr:phosphate transporter_ low-affinity [Candidatus Tachikawaea gelatinosa]